jgi:hypothetical protein
MSAEELAVIFRPAIPRRDYLAKSAEKANARGLTINVGERPNNRHYLAKSAEKANARG